MPQGLLFRPPIIRVFLPPPALLLHLAQEADNPQGGQVLPKALMGELKGRITFLAVFRLP
ncbi:MAG: hypothetical protein WGN25_11805 [Candidatus Electrothrix sp. GW3-4]|uniref:hypothetical protein n=1 Tax=Candidatus Electrothrix sp. GW3-4 TaxID=3126740 RepID=UPI0030D41489